MEYALNSGFFAMQKFYDFFNFQYIMKTFAVNMSKNGWPFWKKRTSPTRIQYLSADSGYYH